MIDLDALEKLERAAWYERESSPMRSKHLEFVMALIDSAPELIAELRRLRANAGLEALDRLSALEPGWDSYKGKPITKAALDAARAILSTPGYPVPTSDGGIQIEWHCGGVDLENSIHPDGTLEECECGHQAKQADAELRRLRKVEEAARNIQDHVDPLACHAMGCQCGYDALKEALEVKG